MAREKSYSCFIFRSLDRNLKLNVLIGNSEGHGTPNAWTSVRLNNSQIAQNCDILADVLEVSCGQLVNASIDRARRV